jgi:predicted dehydrogenase
MPHKTPSVIRWGIIGCGNVTEVKSGPGFQKALGSQLVAVMRRNGELARDYASRHGVPRWYDDAEALIADKEVDAIYIATPPGSHEMYAVKALAARKPAYVEKPMARNHAECRRMVEAFAAAGMPLFVAYYRRALPRFVKTKELVESGRLGAITGVSYHSASPGHRGDPKNLPWRLVAEQSGGGLFLDVGSHTLDALDFILGPLVHVSGIAANLASNFDVEDAVVMTFCTPSGALGTASWNFAAGHHEDRIEIVGTAGRLSLSTFGNDPVQLQCGDRLETFDLPNPPHIQQPLIQSIVSELSGAGRSPSTGESAARTSQVMDIVLESYYGSRGDGFWTDPTQWPGRRG